LTGSTHFWDVRRRGAATETGQALIAVLIFLALFGLLISFVLTSAQVNLKGTQVVRAKDNKIYAADAGIEHGIQRLRLDPTKCASKAAGTTSLGTVTVNGRTVDVNCTTLSGFSVGANGWAVITTENATTSLQTQSSPGTKRSIDGVTYASGIDNSIDVTEKDGDIYERMSPQTCDTDADKPLNLMVSPSPQFAYHCADPDSTHSAYFPSPAPGVLAHLPALGPDPAPVPVVSGNCTTFFPGKYTAAPTFTEHNYMVSGTYYFENVDLRLVNEDLVGGRNNPGETPINGTTPCDPNVNTDDPTDPAAAGYRGTGVKLIMGGTSSLFADNPKGSAELFARCPPLPPATVADPCDPDSALDSITEGTRGISFMSVPATAPAPWVPSSLTVTSNPIIGVGNGTNPALTFQGLIYAPAGFIDFFGTNSSEAQIRGGVVAGRLKLQSSSSATGLVVSTLTRSGVRKIVVKAIAKGVVGGDVYRGAGRDVIGRAVVTIANDASRTVTIQSWDTDRSN
jgi:hypothetical protein